MVWTHAFNLPPKAVKACFLHAVPNGQIRGCTIFLNNFFEQFQISSHSFRSHSTRPLSSSLSPTAHHGQAETNVKKECGEEQNQRRNFCRCKCVQCMSVSVPRASRLIRPPSRACRSSFPFPLFRHYSVPNFFDAATICTTHQPTPYFSHHAAATSAAADTTVAPASPARSGMSRACKQQSPHAIAEAPSKGESF